MKIHTLILLSFFSIEILAQEKSKYFDSYQAIDYMLLFNPNSNKNSYYDGNEGKIKEPSKFVLAGLAGQYEYGIAYKEWIRLGALTGIYANIYDSSYSIPIAASLTLAPKIGNETRIYGKYALGWNTAIGRGNTNGIFTNYQFGIELDGDTRLFIFVSTHSFRIKNEAYQTIGIGYGGTLFKNK